MRYTTLNISLYDRSRRTATSGGQGAVYRDIGDAITHELQLRAPRGKVVSIVPRMLELYPANCPERYEVAEVCVIVDTGAPT